LSERLLEFASRVPDHSLEQAALAAVVVKDELLVHLSPARDPFNAGPVESPLRKLISTCGEDP
jgi:hypothetical protein